MGDKELHKYEVRLNALGWIIIGLATATLYFEMVDYALPQGIYFYSNLIDIFGYDDAAASSTIYLLVGISLLDFLLTLFIGVRAIIVAYGGQQNKVANFLVWAGLILQSLIFLSQAFSFLTGQIDIEISNAVFALLFIFVFVVYMYLVKKTESIRDVLFADDEDLGE